MNHPMNLMPISSANEGRQNILVATASADAKPPQDGLGCSADQSCATLPPWRPVIRPALSYDLAMRVAAARAAAAQPRLAAVASNVITWREVPL